MLDDGKISAYFGDRSILLYLIRQSKAPEKLRLADDYLSVEPYALALPRGDSDFSPEKALMLAILEDAIRCFQEYFRTTRARPRMLSRQADLLLQLPIQRMLDRLALAHTTLRELPAARPGALSEKYLAAIAHQDDADIGSIPLRVDPVAHAEGSARAQSDLQR